MTRNRFKLFIFVVISFHLLNFCVNYVDSFYTQRQRYASRMLKITPRECSSSQSSQFPGLTGICMISMECHQRGGLVIGACRDGHLFGACCHDQLASKDASSSTTTSTTTEPSTTTTTSTPSTTTTKLTTTTTIPTTTPTTSTTTTTTTTTEEPHIISNDISSDVSLESDSTAIPSLIDTFSELSPTFLSELALDEHTTGIYSRGGEDLLAAVDVDINGNRNENQVRDDHDQDGDNTGPNSGPSSSSASSTEGSSAATDSMMMTSGSDSPSPLPVLLSSSSALPPVVQDEVGGLAGLGHDPDFKDNMIKYIDDIVTMRSNNEVMIPFGEDNIIHDSPDINDLPFSTFTIVSSTKATESSSPVTWSWSTTTSGSDLSTTTQNPTTSTTETTTTTSTTTPPPPPVSSTEYDFTSSSSASTERVSPSEEILSVSVAQSVNDGVATDQTSTVPVTVTSPEAPTKFTFSKLKYTPRPYQPRSTTEKVVWTRPAAIQPDKPVVSMIDPDEEASLEDELEQDKLRTSASPSSTTEATSTEMMMTTSTEGYSPYSYIPTTENEITGYDNVSADTEADIGEGDDVGDIQGHYFGDDLDITSTTEEQDPSYYYSPSSSTSDSPFGISTAGLTGLEGIDWTSPTVISLLKGTSESFENLYYGNGSRSDLNGMPLPSAAANEITSPSSSPSTWSTGYSTAYGNYGGDNTIGSSPSTSTTGFSSPTTGFSSYPTTAYAAPSTGHPSSPSSNGPYSSPSNGPYSSPSNGPYSSPSNGPYSSPLTSTGYPSSVSPSAPSPSLWDTSIDSFVDQVVEGIVHDLNKSNNIDKIIFNNNNNNNKKGVKGVQKRKGGSSEAKTAATTTASASTGKSNSNKKISSSTPSSAAKFTSLKSKLKSAIKKSKFKTTSMKPLTSSESPIVSTTSKESLKVKVKTTKVPTPVTKTRITKNKTKPVKKVTTSKSPNSTRKRLNYKRDCGVRPLMKRGRIVGGTPSRFGSWPWHALVKETVWWGIFSKIKCGGVLIGPQHVLTAAHCQPQQTGTLSVVLGVTDSDGDTDSRAVTKTVRRIIPHPQFNARTYENDIAILELESPIDFQPHIVPICLPRDEDELEGKTAFVTGMGLLKHDGERPLVLQEVDLPILNNTECQKMFKRSGNKKPIIESFICAGYEQGRKDSCGGDSGGPLSVKRPNGQWVLAGTVSHGIKCALPDQPGVYMRTSYYKPWIDRVLSKSRSRYRGIPRCNAPPLVCARQRANHQLRQQQGHTETGFVNTLFRIFRLARKMVKDGRRSG